MATSSPEQLLKSMILQVAEQAKLSTLEYVAYRVQTAPISPYKRDLYLSNITFSVNTDSLVLNVGFNSKDAEEIENGEPSVDLKTKFATSPNAPKRKYTIAHEAGVVKNGWYFNIPFYFASSKEVSAWQNNQLDLSNARVSGVARPDVERALASDPRSGIMPVRLSASKSAPGVPGADIKRSPGDKVGLMQGTIQHMRSETRIGGASGSGARATTFATIRTMSAASDPSSWILPATSGLHLTDEASQYFEQTFNDMAETVFK